MKILLVEDDLDQLAMMAFMLRRERFVVVEASDAGQALRRSKMERPDLVVLSLALPPPGGLEVLSQLRAEDRTPVLVIAARDDRDEIARCFELGADDLMTKPYIFRELVLRIRAILGRIGGPVRVVSEAQLELGDLRLDPETHEVARGSSVIRLTPTEFRIFYTLAKSGGHVVPVNRLFAYVWGSERGAAHSLRSHICHVRKKLGLDGGVRGSIDSVPAVGYVFKTSAPPTETAPPGAIGEHAAAGS
jgi:DNA-binding response OmpR family regulator